MTTEKIKSYVCEMTSEQIKQFKTILENQFWEFKPLQYAHWQARKNKTTITAYNSGKVTIQGQDTHDTVLFIVEPEILKKATLGYEMDVCEETGTEKEFIAHAGIDESGKGDFFGPLVICAAYVNEKTKDELIKIGVKDSKAIKSDTKIAEIAKRIRAILYNQYAIVTIGPEAYNRLYSSFDNLNKLLAWGHARSLENLLEKVPDCTNAIADKFGNERFINNALMKKGKDIELVQIIKGEQDIAVAAASILARDQFVSSLNKLSESLGITLPKGASAKVEQAGREICDDHGSDKLASFGKMHFKTAEKIINNGIL